MLHRDPMDPKGSRGIFPASDTKSARYEVILALVKFLRCFGVFLVYYLLRNTHIFVLLFLMTAGSAVFSWVVQKPLSKRGKISPRVWTKVFQLAVFQTFIQTLWLYGVTLCGPLRTILVFEQSSLVISGAVSCIALGCRATASKVRGTVFLVLGVFSLVVMDRDSPTPEGYHQNQSGFSHLFNHIVGWFGVTDHKGGVFLLLLGLLLKAGHDNAFKRISVEVEGSKRLSALLSLISTLVLLPCAVIAGFVKGTNPDSWLWFLVLSVVASFLVYIADRYGEAVAGNHLDTHVVQRWCPIFCFISAFLIGQFWTYSSPETEEHGLSGGVVFSLIFFVLAAYILSEPERVRKRGQFIGWDDEGVPKYVLGEDFLQKTTQSIADFVRNSLKQILADSDSRRIFIFLCVNLAFCFVEFAYGALTNSLGLISDGFHMLFDCTALVMGLVASVMSKWKPTKLFSYGFGRVEVLSGFINALFLVVIAFFILIEAIERLYDPPHVHTDRLLVVSIAGLLVNLFGMYAFGHVHSHGGGGDGHDHSHDGGHGHSHGGGNANMQGVFLHVLADTLGSVFVIISAGLIQMFGWHWVDPFCSLILASLIFASTLPLLRSSTGVIIQKTPVDLQDVFQATLEKVLALDGVVSYSRPQLWELKSEWFVASIHVQVSNDVNHQKVTQQVINLLRGCGVTQVSVQVEKDQFLQQITAICPSYHFPTRVPRTTLQNSVFVRAV